MKESGPESEGRSIREVSKNAVLTVAILGISLTVAAAIIKIVRPIDSPDKYRMEFKTKPSKDNTPPEIEIRLIRQCVDQGVGALPSPATKTFYKDCE